MPEPAPSNDIDMRRTGRVVNGFLPIGSRRLSATGVFALTIWAAGLLGGAAAQQNDADMAARLVSAEQLQTEILALDGDAELGQYLGGDCATCHQMSGDADGIPPIVGLPEDYLVRAMVEYKLDIRANTVMKSRTSHLANDEIAALAAYFASLAPN